MLKVDSKANCEEKTPGASLSLWTHEDKEGIQWRNVENEKWSWRFCGLSLQQVEIMGCWNGLFLVVSILPAADSHQIDLKANS